MNSAQQLADGLTKPAARDVFAEQLRRGVHQLKFDPNYTAAKKVSHEAKQKEIEEHEEAAKQLFGAEALLGEEFKPPGQCQLPGCEKEVVKCTGSEKYCSRRHFYKHHARRSSQDDMAKRAAVAASILAASKLPVAEGASHDAVEDYSFEWKLLVTVVVLLLFSLYGMKEFFYKVILFVKDFGGLLKSEEILEEDEVVIE